MKPPRKRLAEAFAYLERLERQRAQGRNPMLGRLVEYIVIRRELRDLERQAAGERAAPPRERSWSNYRFATGPKPGAY